MLFVHLFGGLPLFLLLALVRYCSKFILHLSLSVHAICSVQLHFKDTILAIKSIIFVFSLIQVFLFPSISEMLSIDLSLPCCVIAISVYAPFLVTKSPFRKSEIVEHIGQILWFLNVMQCFLTLKYNFIF